MSNFEKFYLEDGSYIRYKKSGSGNPLILLHTIRNRLEYFDLVTPFLTKSFTVYALDLPGFGDSPVNKNMNYDQSYMTKALSDFVVKNNLSKLILAGESIGGVLCATVASVLPKRVESLFAALENKLILWFIFRGGVFNKKAISFSYVSLLSTSTRKSFNVYHTQNVFLNFKSWTESKKCYAGLELPVTLVYGDHDWSLSKERSESQGLLSPQKYLELKDTGHFSFIEVPEKVAEIIKS